jgi:nucleotidyltransferase/DNA polymerase involved in DNA repair
MVNIDDITGIGPTKAEKLEENGYESVEDVAQADPANLEEISGISEERALEYMISAGELLDDESEDESDEELEEGEEEFDLTPAEVSEETEESEDNESEEEEEIDSEDTDDASEEEEEPYEVSLSFASKTEYDVYHAALMRHHERVYTSYQPDADAMQKLLDGLTDVDSVTYELTESELNTLHTAVKQTRNNYQGDNMIDHMDALVKVENQIEEARSEYLF